LNFLSYAIILLYHTSILFGSHFTISTSNTIAQIGEYVDIIISLDENQNGLFATSLNLDFDTSQLELVSIQDALISARNIYADTNANQAQVDIVANDLRTVIEVLVRVELTPREVLRAVIADAESRIQANYTPVTWRRMQTAFVRARNINSSPSQIEAAFNDLMAALEALVRR